MNVRCMIQKDEANNDFQCILCLVRGATADTVVCPMPDVDTSHQRRGAPTLAPEVSTGPATATEALVEALVEPAAPEPDPLKANLVFLKTPRNGDADAVVPPSGVNEELVASLERYLQEAKSGQIQAMAFAGIRPPSATKLQGTFSSWNIWHEDVHIGLMVGAIHWLIYRMAKSFDDGGEK